MKNLLKYCKYIKKLHRYRKRDRLLLFIVCILTFVFRMAILLIPFKRLKKYMGDVNKESSYEIDKSLYKELGRIKWAIEKVADKTPWQSKCLVQSLTAQFLLNHKKIDSTLYLGVSKRGKVFENIEQGESKSDFIAHSWIRCGEVFVTGGSGENFAVVAKFRKVF